jgi:hypothetical protein
VTYGAGIYEGVRAEGAPRVGFTRGGLTLPSRLANGVKSEGQFKNPTRKIDVWAPGLFPHSPYRATRPSCDTTDEHRNICLIDTLSDGGPPGGQTVVTSLMSILREGATKSTSDLSTTTLEWWATISPTSLALLSSLSVSTIV